MEYSFSRHVWDPSTRTEEEGFGLGFRANFWRVINLERDSGLFDKQVEDNLPQIRRFLESTGLRAWNAHRVKRVKAHEGDCNVGSNAGIQMSLANATQHAPEGAHSIDPRRIERGFFRFLSVQRSETSGEERWDEHLND